MQINGLNNFNGLNYLARDYLQTRHAGWLRNYPSLSIIAMEKLTCQNKHGDMLLHTLT